MKSDDNIRLESKQYDETNLEFMISKKKLETKLLEQEPLCQKRISELYTKTGKLPEDPYRFSECYVALPIFFRSNSVNSNRLQQDWKKEFNGRFRVYRTRSLHDWDETDYEYIYRAAIVPEYARIAFEKEFSKKN